MNADLKKNAKDIGKLTISQVIAAVLTLGALASAWTAMGGSWPATKDSVAQVAEDVEDLSARLDEAQATYLFDKLLQYQEDLSRVELRISGYMRRQQDVPTEAIDLRDNILGQIQRTERRIRKLGYQP